MQAQIKEKREVAQGTHLVIFDLLDREVDFEPGLYFFVTLTARCRPPAREGASPAGR
jgi:NAD(P)H-flavin reductase